VKEWGQLLTRKGRDKLHKFIVEGSHLVQEALQSGADVESVVYLQDMPISREIERLLGMNSKAETVAVSEAVLAKCTDTETPQPIFAVVRKPEAGSGAWLLDKLGEGELVVVVDGVQDPGNLGTIIRSADAVGAAAVLLGRGTVDLYNPKTIRSTMGSLFHVQVAEADLQELLPRAAACGRRIVATSLRESRSVYELDLRQPTWLVLGNEGAGVSPQVEALATERVIIPMSGRAESLNVAMAATVLLFEAARQRGFSK
jgi:TrmH family RNA methyltransferase